jgi:hypothetical protein
VVGVPDFVYNGTVGYRARLWPKLLLQVGVQGNDGYFADDANTIAVPRSANLTATASVDESVAITRGITARGFVTITNLWNRRYVASAYLNPDIVAGQPLVFEPGLPRALQLSVIVGRNR